MSALPIVIELAGMPKGKGAVRPTIRFGGKLNVFQPRPTAEYLAALRYSAQQTMAGQPPTSAAVAVQIIVSMRIPDSRPARWRSAALGGTIRPTVKPDVDNFAKMVGDACNGVVWVDDKQIVDLRVRKIYAPAPSLRVEVLPWTFEGATDGL